MEANRMEQGQVAYENYVDVCESPSQMHNDNGSFGDCGDSYAAYSVSEPSLYISNTTIFSTKSDKLVQSTSREYDSCPEGGDWDADFMFDNQI